jgi:hypothetical protein
LYADAQADGMAIRRTDALALIRAIGSNGNASRMVLLERHLKDYQWLDYGGKNALVQALVEGLTSTKSADDAAMALNLSQRILGDAALSKEARYLIISGLSATSNYQHIQQAYQLLLHSHDLNSSRPYDDLISSYIKLSASKVNADDRLRHAISIYRLLLARKIPLSTRTNTNLIRALIEAGHLDSALAAFHSALDASLQIKSHAIGRLMIGLIMAGREQEAGEVEDAWRNNGEGLRSKQWDRGVVGARALLDMKAGIEVDLARVERETGWKPNPSFALFMQSLKPRPVLDDCLVVDGSSALEVEQIHGDGDERGGGTSKKRIKPLTRSLWDQSMQLGWMDDRENSEVMGERHMRHEGRAGIVGV